MVNNISFGQPYDSNNIFAQILRGEIPNITVLETDTCLAFMDLMPQAPGHTLVIPKTPAVTLLDLPVEALNDLISCTQKVARAVQKGLNADGFSVVQLNGTAGGQTVPHIHFHIIPGSVLTARGHAATVADNDELAAYAAKIRAALD